MKSHLHEAVERIQHRFGLVRDIDFEPVERRGSITVRVNYNGRHEALKVSDGLDLGPTGQTAAAQALNEARILKLLGSGPWPALYDSGYIEEECVAFARLQWLQKPSVLDQLRRLRGQPGYGTEASEAVSFSFRALAELHGRGVIHGDIQPTHILLDKEVSRSYLIDFGISSTLECAKEGMYKGGMVHFDPPELAADILRFGVGARSIQGDIYALGASIIYSFTDKVVPAYPRPKAGMSWNEKLETIASESINPHTEEIAELGVSMDLVKIVAQCVSPRVELRFQTADEVVRKISEINSWTN